ncbi:MAG: hypothetical protein LC775_09155, partial [Acidobacteria bacterium]|nr:hypothetical protein [Acidobacteriota bacterium]
EEMKAMDDGHLVGGIVLLVIGGILILNAVFQWVFKDDPDRDPSKGYNFMHSITPYPEPIIRKFLGVIGAGLGLWGAYLVLRAIGPGS